MTKSLHDESEMNSLLTGDICKRAACRKIPFQIHKKYRCRSKNKQLLARKGIEVYSNRDYV